MNSFRNPLWTQKTRTASSRIIFVRSRVERQVHNRLYTRTCRSIDALNVDDQQALAATAQQLQAVILAAAIPGAVRDELTMAYRELSRRDGSMVALVAVGSSTTMEDTKQASFAGMNQSFLNVRGEDALVRKVREVWASLFSSRVIFYRKRLQMLGEPEIAVIVQKMVNAEKSGVAFSIDPATGNEQTIIIEAAFGLGEVVVSGQVEPDHYAVSKPDLRLQMSRVGNKSFMLTQDAEGRTVQRELSPEHAAARMLTDEEVRAVAELVRRDEARYGRRRADLPHSVPAGDGTWAAWVRFESGGPILPEGTGSGPGCQPRLDNRPRQGRPLVWGGGGHPSGRDPGRAGDFTGLGSPHAPGRGHRYRQRWNDLACGYRLSRAWRAKYRRRRPGALRAPGRHARHG